MNLLKRRGSGFGRYRVPEGGARKSPSTTRMSSKGQVVIPEEIRKRLNFSTGSRFVVPGDDDVVILKRIDTPDMSDFDSLIREARRQARSSGMRKSDIREAVVGARGRK